MHGMRNGYGISRWAAVLSVSALLTACSPGEVSATLVVQTDGGTPQQIARTAEVLAARIDELATTMSSTVTGNTITFTFRGDAPSEQVLRPLALTPGVLRITPADKPDELWVSDTDVVDATMARTDSGFIVNVRVSPEAGRRLQQMTSQHVGGKGVITFDGKMVVYATIRAPFGERFVLTAPSRDEGHLMALALRSGRLPVPVKSLEYRTVPHKT